MAIPQPGRTALQQAAARAGTRLLLCGHVHRARLEWHDGIAVGLNGQSGAEWAQRTIAFYDIGASAITAAFEPGV
jgi:predicted phosphodiesterase